MAAWHEYETAFLESLPPPPPPETPPPTANVAQQQQRIAELESQVNKLLKGASAVQGVSASLDHMMDLKAHMAVCDGSMMNNVLYSSAVLTDKPASIDHARGPVLTDQPAVMI
jgi:beta-phosphoglucomutase-like phosphatase (HAD superfamily)